MDTTVVGIIGDGDDGERRRPLLEPANEIHPYPEPALPPQPPGTDPKPEQQKPPRVASLDVFRGLTVAVSRIPASSRGFFLCLPRTFVPIVTCMFACACADDDTRGRRRRGVAGDKPRAVVRGDGGGLRHARLPLHHWRLCGPRLQGTTENLSDGRHNLACFEIQNTTCSC